MAGTTRVQSFGEFVNEIRNMPGKLEVEFNSMIHRVLLQTVKAGTPRLDKGAMKASWGSTTKTGGKRPMATVLAGLKPGGGTRVVSDSWKLSSLYDPGRRLTKGKKRSPYPIGSERIPNGVTKPALSKVESRRAAIARFVIKKVENSA